MLMKDGGREAEEAQGRAADKQADQRLGCQHKRLVKDYQTNARVPEGAQLPHDPLAPGRAMHDGVQESTRKALQC